MSEVEQRRERVAGDRARQAIGAVQGGGDAARRATARRNAWLLGGIALTFYFGYMAWFLIRGTFG